MGEVLKFNRDGSFTSTSTKTETVDAPYVEPDKSQLGDKHLNPEEAVFREREDLLRIASQSKIYGQDELESPDRSSGARMYYTELICRLLKANRNLKFLDGKPGSIAVYRHKQHWEYLEDERDTSRGSADFFWHHKYVGGFEKGYLPEYSHVLLDSSHLPTREVRGWRSVLLSLIKGHAITVDQAIQEFGDPAFDQRAGRWREQIHEFRSKPNQHESQYQ